MVSSIWKPEMVMYLSNTAKQSELGQWTAKIPASAPQFRTMPPVCHYPQFRCYWPLTVLFWAPVSIRCPLYNPSLHLEGNSSVHYSQWPKQIGKTDLWRARSQGKGRVSLLSSWKYAPQNGLSFSRLDFRPSLTTPPTPPQVGNAAGSQDGDKLFFICSPLQLPSSEQNLLWIQEIKASAFVLCPHILSRSYICLTLRSIKFTNKL